MKTFRGAFAALGTTLVMGMTAAVTPASAQYFEGKTIKVVVGFATGGTDTAARIIARRLGDYTPGNPTIIVKNMPGAGNLLAQNFVFERADPDGLTIGFNPFQVMTQVTGQEGVRFSYPEFTYIAGVKGPGFATVARANIVEGGFDAPADIAKIDKPLLYTGRNALHSIDVLSTISLDVLGLEYTYVPGFSGSPDLTTSMEQDETNITGAGSVHYVAHIVPPLMDKGIAVPLYQFGLIQEDGSIAPDDTYPDVPLFRDFYADALGGEPSGEVYEAFVFAEQTHGLANWLLVGPPGIDPEIADILREAARQAMADPETIAETLKIESKPFEFISFARASGPLDAIKNLDPAMEAFWKERVTRMLQ